MLLDIQNLIFGWQKETLFENINCQLMRGEILQLMGENGSGKTTLLHLISGMIPHFSRGETLKGEILINGHSILIAAPKSFFPTIAFIPSLNLDFFLLTESLKQEMLLTTAILEINAFQAKKRLDEFSNFFPSINELIDIPFKAMAMDQKILAISLVFYLQDPQLFLFDEVFTVFNESLVQSWHSFFRWLSSQNYAIIFVDHQHQAEGIRKWVLTDKKLVSL